MSISTPISKLNCNLMKAKYDFYPSFLLLFLLLLQSFATFHSPLLHSSPLHFSADGFSSFIVFLLKLTVNQSPKLDSSEFSSSSPTPQPLTTCSHPSSTLISLGQYLSTLHFNYFSDHLTCLLKPLFLNRFSLLTCKQFILLP